MTAPPAHPPAEAPPDARAPIRILHILDHSLPMMSGYTTRTRAILKAGEGRGWAVAGVTGLRHTAGSIRVGEEAREVVDGLTFHRTPPRRTRTPLGEVRALADRIVEVARDFHPDILHAHSPVLNAWAALGAGRRLRRPVLYEIRAFWEDAAVGNGTGTEGSPKFRLTHWAETQAVRRAERVATICHGLKADLIVRGIPEDKIVVSPNGVDHTLFGTPEPRDEALAAELGLAGATVLGFIGSFYPYEGLDLLIAALPTIVAADPTVRLLLVGGGPEEMALRFQAADSPVADRIHFAGRVPHDAVGRYYGLVDLFVYPRRAMRLTELVTPLKPLEAMAEGRLVAASDVGGHRELMTDGETATLFAPDDPGALAAAVTALLADRDGWAERRAAARETVRTTRNWSSNIARYDPVYREMMGRNA